MCGWLCGCDVVFVVVCGDEMCVEEVCEDEDCGKRLEID